LNFSHRSAFVITLRDITIAVLSVTATTGATALAASSPKLMGSVALEWNDVPVKQEEVRAVRQFFRAPTATLNELELHVTTLPAGATSHAPHKHPNEELVIIKEGIVEVLVDGQKKRVGPGSVVFNASNQMHSLNNVGDGPATYHVINWTSAATPR
jgi:quercetin dioxygenase-like cupin family protein